MEHIDILIRVAECIKNGQKEYARSIIKKEYQHNYIPYAKRIMTAYEKLNIYINDGFIDRYSGKKLLFPNVLRIFSYELGKEFPFQPNWKMSH
ncbi:MAG: HNH endonuclease, partial [Spirochaetota bacterium]